MDIDLLGQTSNDLEYLRLAVQEICCSRVEPDGVEFRVETLEIQKIKEDAEYEGARVRLLALVTNARDTLQIDIGFGDVIVPHAAEIEYPVLLEFAAPKLLARSEEHTSELQSRLHLVCRLLLDKKNKDTTPLSTSHNYIS